MWQTHTHTQKKNESNLGKSLCAIDRLPKAKEKKMLNDYFTDVYKSLSEKDLFVIKNKKK